jgi:hypothetical protein
MLELTQELFLSDDSEFKRGSDNEDQPASRSTASSPSFAASEIH